MLKYVIDVDFDGIGTCGAKERQTGDRADSQKYSDVWEVIIRFGTNGANKIAENASPELRFHASCPSYRRRCPHPSAG